MSWFRNYYYTGEQWGQHIPIYARQRQQYGQQAQQYGQQQQQPPQSNSEQPQQDPEGGLSAHNTARQQKGCQALHWSDQLAQDAATHAQKLAAMNRMEHADQEGQGENIYMCSGDASYERAVRSWLKEEQKYHGERIKEGRFSDYGHFTQCVWRGTTHVGMGKARSRNGATYIVARYWPQGNMDGEKPF